MTTRMIIFDLDGTIADTVEVGVDIYNTIARKRGYQLLTKENREHFRSLETRAAIGELGIPWWRIPYIATRIRKGLAEHIGDIHIYDGMKDVVATLAQSYTVALVTSNSLGNARTLLSAHDITAFGDRVYAGVSIFGKTRRIKRLLTHMNIAPHEAIYIGDEVRDVVSAHAAQVPVIAVSWGLNNREALMRAQPEHCADTPADILRVVTQLT